MDMHGLVVRAATVGCIPEAIDNVFVRVHLVPLNVLGQFQTLD